MATGLSEYRSNGSQATKYLGKLLILKDNSSITLKCTWITLYTLTPKHNACRRTPRIDAVFLTEGVLRSKTQEKVGCDM